MKVLFACTTVMFVYLAGTNGAYAEQACLKNAWIAFNGAKYSLVLNAADDCIDQFSGRAFRDEARLESIHEKQPPTGAVDNPFDQKRIFDRWAVNDVSTAYFLRGQAAEQIFKTTKKLVDKKIARESYTLATRLSYGRCWDPQGWFWSPAEAAADRLLALK